MQTYLYTVVVLILRIYTFLAFFYDIQIRGVRACAHSITFFCLFFFKLTHVYITCFFVRNAYKHQVFD